MSPMTHSAVENRFPTNPPVCPSCRSSAHVDLDEETRGTDARQVWRCEKCGVRWEEALTPRSER